MPRGTRPCRLLSLRLFTLSGEVVPLVINSSNDVGKLRQTVRRLTKNEFAFDLVHEDRGWIFGNCQDYESDPNTWWNTRKKKQCNLRIRIGCAIKMVLRPKSVDDDGDDIPALVTDSDDSV